MAIEIAGELKHGNALSRIRKDDDRGKEIHEFHFAAGEDRSACDAELMAASLAFELAAGGNVIALKGAAARTNGFAFRFRPAKLLELNKSLLLTAGIDLPEAYCAGCRAEEKMG